VTSKLSADSNVPTKDSVLGLGLSVRVRVRVRVRVQSGCAFRDGFFLSHEVPETRPRASEYLQIVE